MTDYAFEPLGDDQGADVEITVTWIGGGHSRPERPDPVMGPSNHHRRTPGDRGGRAPNHLMPAQTMTDTTAPAPTARPLDPSGRYADINWAEYRRLCRSVQYPRPRCSGEAAGVYGPNGTECTTPNGWACGFHREREQAAGVRPAPGTPGTPGAPGTRRHRLSDAQAERIEWAAERGVYYAPDQYAAFRGDARERAIADVLVREGLMEHEPDGPADADDRRRLVLTAAGWDIYWHHKLIIRRVPAADAARHAEHCPRCARTGETAPRKAHA